MDMSDDRKPQPQEETPQDDAASGDKAKAMEKAQEEAAEERENERGYQ